MPIYTYECPICYSTYDKLHSFDEKVTVYCSKCIGENEVECKKIISASSVIIPPEHEAVPRKRRT